jgi:hypothetical protein
VEVPVELGDAKYSHRRRLVLRVWLQTLAPGWYLLGTQKMFCVLLSVDEYRRTASRGSLSFDFGVQEVWVSDIPELGFWLQWNKFI